MLPWIFNAQRKLQDKEAGNWKSLLPPRAAWSKGSCAGSQAGAGVVSPRTKQKQAGIRFLSQCKNRSEERNLLSNGTGGTRARAAPSSAARQRVEMPGGSSSLACPSWHQSHQGARTPCEVGSAVPWLREPILLRGWWTPQKRPISPCTISCQLSAAPMSLSRTSRVEQAWAVPARPAPGAGEPLLSLTKP